MPVQYGCAQRSRALAGGTVQVRVCVGGTQHGKACSRHGLADGGDEVPVEGLQHHLVGAAESLQQRGVGSGLAGLVLHHGNRARQHRAEGLFEGGNGLAGGSHRLQLLVQELGHQCTGAEGARRIGGAVEGLVVQAHEHPVAGCAHVELDHPDASSHGCLEGCKGVLGVVTAVPAVGNHYHGFRGGGAQSLGEGMGAGRRGHRGRVAAFAVRHYALRPMVDRPGAGACWGLEPETHSMKTLRRFVVLLVVVGAAAAAWWWFTRPQPVVVRLHTVERGVVESTVANTRAGTIRATRRAGLSPGTGGQVGRLHVKEGDRVQAGQVMLELWNDDLQAQLLLATSELDRSRALAEEARLRADIAERESKRQLELQQQGMAPEERVERAVMEAQAARAEEVAARADSMVREHQTRLIAAQIERTVLRAPFAGIVAEVSGEVGEYVTPSPVGIMLPAAVDLIDDTSLYVSAPIDEVDASRVRTGMVARVTMDAFGRKTFAGKVRRIAPYVLDREKQARTVDVEVDLDPGSAADVLLLAGYSADVEVLLEERPDVLRVPTEAVREDSVVLVVGPDNVVERRAVRTGLSNWRHTEVLEGLVAGDRIVLATDREGMGAGTVVVEEVAR
ncbi:MAG: hypothetical protein RL148_3241 [Planctomycetota bacterium]